MKFLDDENESEKKVMKMSVEDDNNVESEKVAEDSGENNLNDRVSAHAAEIINDAGEIVSNEPILMIRPQIKKQNVLTLVPPNVPKFQGLMSRDDILVAIDLLQQVVKNMDEPEEKFGKLPENLRAGDYI